MAETNEEAPSWRGKGKKFFDRADEVAETGNWDFAIELYVGGIAREPDDLERGHAPLRNVSLNRKAQGGKGPGMGEKFKRRPGKDLHQNLTNAEYLLAKEPGSVAFMEQVLKAANALKIPDVIKWICDIMLEAQRQAPKPNVKVLVLVTQSYHDIEQYGPAIQACNMTVKAAPANPQFQEALNELSVKYTIQQGQYDQKGDFTKGVADMKTQQELMEKDRMAQSTSYMEKQIEKTRQEYEAEPSVMGKIIAFVDALLKPEDESYENEAIDVLAKAYADTEAYQYKMRMGDVKIRQMTRRYRKLVDQGDKEAAKRHLKEQLAFELEEYSDRAKTYPTDLAVKYELGRRQFLAGKYDEAIASLQQAQRDPRRHVRAMHYLGQAFAKKSWYPEAADTFRRALQAEVSEQREKELRYGLGNVLEQMAELPEALDELSKVAQIEYNYKDVRDRIEKLRRKIDGTRDQG